MKLYLTRNETAKLLGVTPQTVSNYLEKGLLVESSKRNPKTKAMRILRQSVETLLEEGYDVLEQSKAMEALSKELKETREYFLRKRDELKADLAILEIKRDFQLNVREFAELVTSYLKGNDIISKPESIVILEILSGNSVEGVAKRLNLCVSSVRYLYHKCCNALYEGQHPSYNELQQQNKNLIEKLSEERKRYAELALLPKGKGDSLDEGVIYVLQALIGLGQGLSVRLYNNLRAGNFENLYEMVFVSRASLMHIRNFGRKSLNELDQLMEHYGLRFNDISSLASMEVQSLTGPFFTIPIKEVRARLNCRSL
jgi:predicted transcriptional regulator